MKLKDSILLLALLSGPTACSQSSEKVEEIWGKIRDNVNYVINETAEMASAIFHEEDTELNNAPNTAPSQEILPDRFEEIENFLNKDFNGFEKSDFQHPSLGTFALSNIAEGMLSYVEDYPENKERIMSYLEKIIQAMLHDKVSPYKQNIENISNLGENGSYLTHLNIILGSYSLTGGTKYDNLHEKISAHLSQKSVQDPQKHVRPYANQKHKWPADQAATLYSLWLFDESNKTNLSNEPINDWLMYMHKNAIDKNTGLHISNITGKKYAQFPRGSALAWSIKYMAKFAPEEAAKQWELFKEHFMISLGIGNGFREYPKGVNQVEDSDSGPIILEIGSSASAFAMAAAASMDDIDTYNKLHRSFSIANTGITILGDDFMKNAASDVLAKSIVFNAESQAHQIN